MRTYNLLYCIPASINTAAEEMRPMQHAMMPIAVRALAATFDKDVHALQSGLQVILSSVKKSSLHLTDFPLCP